MTRGLLRFSRLCHLPRYNYFPFSVLQLPCSLAATSIHPRFFHHYLGGRVVGLTEIKKKKTPASHPLLPAVFHATIDCSLCFVRPLLLPPPSHSNHHYHIRSYSSRVAEYCALK